MRVQHCCRCNYESNIMSTTVVMYEVVDNIAVITLNRPDKRNAMNNELTTALRAAWERFNASDERVAILTHAGEHFLCWRRCEITGGRFSRMRAKRRRTARETAHRRGLRGGRSAAEL
jgi:enoyl-CoA hydratase/carnithine racemase